MSNRTTINISKDEHKRAKAAKADHETWGDYLIRCADADAIDDLVEIRRQELEAAETRGGTISALREDIQQLQDAVGRAEATDGGEIDEEALAEAIAERIVQPLTTEMELSARRGAKDAIEELSR